MSPLVTRLLHLILACRAAPNKRAALSAGPSRDGLRHASLVYLAEKCRQGGVQRHPQRMSARVRRADLAAASAEALNGE